MREHVIIVFAAFKKSPIAAFFVSATWVQTFVETSMPVLQWLLAFAGLVFTVFQILIKRKELQALSKEASVYKENDTRIP